MARKRREHKHDLKTVAFNRPIKELPGHMAKIVRSCRTCGAVTFVGVRPDPDYRPAVSGRPRDVLAWIESRLAA